MVIIGIVGVPAGGKSTVAKQLRGLGATWVHADRLAHRALDWPDVQGHLRAYFGSNVVGRSGKVDRKVLADLVFGDDADQQEGLDYLQSVVHPFTRHLALRRLQRAGSCGIKAAVLDAPLLLEADWGVLCDCIWCVDAPWELRLRWITQRGWDEIELRRREQRQMPIDEKRRLATNVIDNRSGLPNLQANVLRLWNDLIHQEQDEPLTSDDSKQERAEANLAHCLKYPPSRPSQPPLTA